MIKVSSLNPKHVVWCNITAASNRLNTKYKPDIWKQATEVLVWETHCRGTWQLYKVYWLYTHTDTHTDTHIYMCVCVCICQAGTSGFLVMLPFVLQTLLLLPSTLYAGMVGLDLGMKKFWIRGLCSSFLSPFRGLGKQRKAFFNPSLWFSNVTVKTSSPDSSGGALSLFHRFCCSSSNHFSSSLFSQSWHPALQTSETCWHMSFCPAHDAA